MPCASKTVQIVVCNAIFVIIGFIDNAKILFPLNTQTLMTMMKALFAKNAPIAVTSALSR